MIINRILKMPLLRIGDKLMEKNGKLVTIDLDIGDVQPRHLRLRFTPGTGPNRDDITSHRSGTWVQICTDPNIWDLYVLDGVSQWSNALSLASEETRINIIGVIDGDASDVTYMDGCFANCPNIRSVGPLYNTDSVVSCWHMFYSSNGDGSIVQVTPFDTSNVRSFESMFYGQQKLKVVPLLDTSSSTDLTAMYYGCVNVESGILGAYNEMTSHGSYVAHHMTFHDCGINTPTGKAELAQIPDDWK